MIRDHDRDRESFCCPIYIIFLLQNTAKQIHELCKARPRVYLENLVETTCSERGLRRGQPCILLRTALSPGVGRIQDANIHSYFIEFCAR